MPSPESANRGRTRRGLTALLGIVVSVALLLWAVRGVSLQEIREHISDAHPVPLAAAALVATLAFPIRLIRWRLFLLDERGRSYPADALWHAIALGFMANNVLPLRAGELVRSYTAARLARIRFTTVLSSVAVERIFDGLTVVALLTLALLASDLPPSLTIAGASVAHLAQVGGLAAGVSLLGGILVLAAPVYTERLVRRLLPRPGLSDRIINIIEGLRQGLVVLRSPSRLALVVFWSVVHWCVNALGFYVAFAAFDIPVSYWGALLLQGLLVLGISIPSTPGFFGPFEAVIVAVLALYEIPNDLAFSYAISYHVTSFVPITLLGLWSLARTPGGLAQVREIER